MKLSKLTGLLVAFILCFSLAACGNNNSSGSTAGNQDTQNSVQDSAAEKQETEAIPEGISSPGEGPASSSNIVSINDVPLITLNNGVKVPQLGLGKCYPYEQPEYCLW